MIIGFSGTPGSGKTYEAVRKILDNLRMGRVVYTNIDGMFDPECQEMIKNVCEISDLALTRQLRQLHQEELAEFWLHLEPGCLIVFDEIQKVFSSREWQTSKNNQFAFWASTHRHQGFDLVLITQAIERVDSAVRSLLEWTYVFRKVNFFGSAVQKSYLCYSYAGDDSSGPALKKSVRRYDSAVFLCYKSYVAKDVKELSIMQHVNVLKHPVFFAIPLVLGFVLYMLFFQSSLATGDLFGSKKAIANYEESKKTGQSGNPSASLISPGKENVDDETKGVRGISMSRRNGSLVYTNRGKSND